ncbi:hypothetical protein EYF80_052003 [Liparis tanakae]|uniref:Uncharacterized protein n=1 Tax=Liparis tanakae TaxID=230148 RepID=A0A4Z2FBQ6_9TELE|nr:hypothetical protein EYF80_052003 [Liparis tanakae]
MVDESSECRSILWMLQPSETPESTSAEPLLRCCSINQAVGPPHTSGRLRRRSSAGEIQSSNQEPEQSISNSPAEGLSAVLRQAEALRLLRVRRIAVTGSSSASCFQKETQQQFHPSSSHFPICLQPPLNPTASPSPSRAPHPGPSLQLPR